MREWKSEMGGEKANKQCVNGRFTTLSNWGSIHPGLLQKTVKNTPENVPQGAWKLEYWSVKSHLSLVGSVSWGANSLALWPESILRTIWETCRSPLRVGYQCPENVCYTVEVATVRNKKISSWFWLIFLYSMGSAFEGISSGQIDKFLTIQFSIKIINIMAIRSSN